MQQKRSRMLGFPVMALIASGLYCSLLFAQSISGPYTTTTETALRSGPGMNYGVVATLPKGIKINVVGREAYWLKVESKHGGAAGYIDEQFAQRESTGPRTATNTVAPVAGTYRTLVDVNLRQGPGTKYPVVTKLPSGIKVNVVHAEGDWLRVESKKGGKPGYVEKRFVERSAD